MTNNKFNAMQVEKTSKEKDEVEEFKTFIKKKKTQNKALKKMIEKLNIEENQTTK